MEFLFMSPPCGTVCCLLRVIQPVTEVWTRSGRSQRHVFSDSVSKEHHPMSVVTFFLVTSPPLTRAYDIYLLIQWIKPDHICSGRPRNTWKRDVEKEIWTAGFRYSWRKMEKEAQDRDGWRQDWSVAYVPLAVTRHQSSYRLQHCILYLSQLNRSRLSMMARNISPDWTRRPSASCCCPENSIISAVRTSLLGKSLMWRRNCTLSDYIRTHRQHYSWPGNSIIWNQ